jgi:hypothetical protein
MTETLEAGADVPRQPVGMKLMMVRGSTPELLFWHGCCQEQTKSFSQLLNVVPFN